MKKNCTTGECLSLKCVVLSSILTYVDWEQDIWTLSTINAVYALGEAVHRTLKEKCGDNYMGLCTNFVNASDAQARIMAHMDTMEFVDISSQLFKFIQREANRGFQLQKYTGSGLAELKVRQGQILMHRYRCKEGNFDAKQMRCWDLKIEVGWSNSQIRKSE